MCELWATTLSRSPIVITSQREAYSSLLGRSTLRQRTQWRLWKQSSNRRRRRSRRRKGDSRRTSLLLNIQCEPFKAIIWQCCLIHLFAKIKSLVWVTFKDFFWYLAFSWAPIYSWNKSDALFKEELKQHPNLLIAWKMWNVYISLSMWYIILKKGEIKQVWNPEFFLQVCNKQPLPHLDHPIGHP